MKNLTDKYKLINGVEIPCLGFGTWQIAGETAETAVAEAIRAGYVHIDTAAAYENEEFVGAGIKRSGIKRDELFLTTKLWNNVRGYDETIAACEDSLKKLGTDYVDLYLIHWPNPLKFRSCWKEKNAETWRAFEQLYKDGKVRAIGVSNFCRRHLDALFETAEIMPSVNQIRLCPGDVDDDTVSYSRSKGILLEAYSPLGCGKAFDSDAIKEIAAKYGRSVSQICLNWSLRNGFLPLAKSVSPQHIAENADIFDFELETADVIRLNEMEGECGMHSNPDEKPF
ncbi:MAG: aldo/keto reductase [Oscillospiraceae bacterium]|nr:aldo/keto reductase [Oscillospiraceae bacterium]